MTSEKSAHSVAKEPSALIARAWTLDAAEGRALLRRAAEAGDASAKTALAQHLVSIAPYDVFEGLDWARAAVHAGDGEAAHLLAVLSAEGLGVAQDWNAALDHLARAAECGHAMSQRQLALLARQPVRGGEWRALRDAVDLASWLAPATVEWKSTTPRIAVAENFLDPEACDWLIARARPELKPATVFNSRTGATAQTEMRTNSGFGIETYRMDVVIALLRARMSALTGLPLAGFEDASILNYQIGQHYTAHFDFFSLVPSFAQEIALGGQRVLTFLVYLNADFEGGETDFPTLGWRHRGRKGDALFFWNVGEDGLPERRTLHAGLPPAQGQKWLFSQWVRFRSG